MNYQKMYHFNKIFGFNILEKSRKRDIVWARYAVIYTLHKSGVKTHSMQNLFLMSNGGILRAVREFDRALSVGDKLATSLNARLSDFKPI
jgi:hypothetical protein